MIETVLTAIGKLFEELTWRRFLSILVFGSIAVVAVLLYERYTSNFQLGRVQRAAEILKILSEIEARGLKQGSGTAELHASLASELRRTLSVKPISVRLPSFASATLAQADLFKFVAGGFWWFLLSLFAVRSKFKGDPNAGAGAIGLLFIGLVFGSIGWLLPTVGWPWFNLIVYPVGHLILLVGIIAWVGNRMAQDPPL